MQYSRMRLLLSEGRRLSMGHLTLYQIGRFLLRVLLISAIVIAVIMALFFTQSFWLTPLSATIQATEHRWSDWGDAHWFLKEAAIWFNQGIKILVAPGPLLQSAIFLSTGIALGLFIGRPVQKSRKVISFLWPITLWVIAVALASYTKTDPTLFYEVFVAAIASTIVSVYFTFTR